MHSPMKPQVDDSVLVDDFLRDQPAAIQVFIRERMSCVGCPLNRFCSLAYAATIHGKDLPDLLRQIADEAAVREQALTEEDG